ncbi:MAG: WD40 repeat domain-containing protein [Cyanobacteriota/Melainabacteria group bacterium]
MADFDRPKMRVDEKGELWLTFGEYWQEIDVASFSKDGSRLLTVEDEGVAKIWDTTTKEQIGEIRPTSPLSGKIESPLPVLPTEDFKVFIESAALDNKGELALLGLNDGTAGVFDVATGSRLSTLCQGEAPPENWEIIRAVNYSNDGSLTVVGFHDRAVAVYDRTGEKLIARFSPYELDSFFSRTNRGRKAMISSVAISGDNRYVFAGAGDLTCHIYDLETKKLVFAAVDYREEIIAVGTVNNTILWATAGGIIWKKEGDNEPERVLALSEDWDEAKFAPSGDFILVRTAPGELKKINLADDKAESEVLANLEHYTMFKNTQTICFLDRNNFCNAVSSSTIRINDISIEVALQEGADDRIKEIRPSTDKSILAIKTDWKPTTLWERETGRFIRSLPGDTREHAISRDNKYLALVIGGGEDHSLVLEDLRGEQRLQKVASDVAADIVITFGLEDNTIIGASESDHTVKLWQKDDSGSFKLVNKLVHPFRQKVALSILETGEIVLIREKNGVEVWTSDLKERLAACEMDVGFDSQWNLDKAKKILVLALREQMIEVADLKSGQINRFEPPINRPQWFPEHKISVEVTARNHVALWREFGGPYMHIFEGPRGWAVNINTSLDQKWAVVPCYIELAVVSTERDGEQSIKGRFPFAEKMRAAFVDDNVVKAINNQGRFYQYSL